MATLFTAAEQGFRDALERAPNDATAAKVFVDWMMEFQGLSPMAARREVVRIRREFAEQQQFERVKRQLARDPALAERLRSDIEQIFGSAIREDWELRIVKGGGTPYLSETPRFYRDDLGRTSLEWETLRTPGRRIEFIQAEHFVHCPAAWLARLIERLEGAGVAT